VTTSAVEYAVTVVPTEDGTAVAVAMVNGLEVSDGPPDGGRALESFARVTLREQGFMLLESTSGL